MCNQVKSTTAVKLQRREKNTKHFSFLKKEKVTSVILLIASMGRLAAVTCSTCINLPLLYHRWHKFRVESSSSASWHCSVDNHRQLKHEISKEKKNQKQKQKKKKRRRRRRLCSSVIINKESDWHRWCKIWEISKSSIKSSVWNVEGSRKGRRTFWIWMSQSAGTTALLKLSK